MCRGREVVQELETSHYTLASDHPWLFQWTMLPPSYNHCNTPATSSDAIHHRQCIDAASASSLPAHRRHQRTVAGRRAACTRAFEQRVDSYTVSTILFSIGVVRAYSSFSPAHTFPIPTGSPHACLLADPPDPLLPDGELSQPLGRCRARRRRPRHRSPCPSRRRPPSPRRPHSLDALALAFALGDPSPHAHRFRGSLRLGSDADRHRRTRARARARTRTLTHALALAPAFAFALAEPPRRRALALALVDILRPDLAADRHRCARIRTRTHTRTRTRTRTRKSPRRTRTRIRRPPAT